MTNQEFRLTAKTFHGMEQMLADELSEINAQNIKILNRAVQFIGGKEIYYKANYSCRTALSILLELSYFKAHNEDYLYRKAMEIPWDEYLDVDDTFAIEKTVNSRFFKHSQFTALRLKDAIVDYFNNKYGKRPSVDTNSPDVLFDLHISNERVNISLDTSGESLHKRGYRKETTIAPINEVLAAGLLKAAGFDGTQNLYDPMCGSGTFLCEAAEMTKNIPAGKHRKEYGFKRFKDFDKDLWKTVKEEANKQSKTHTGIKIAGADKDAGALSAGIKNIDSAGLSNDITLSELDFFNSKPPFAEGIIVTNPPYNERLKVENTKDFYKTIGDTLKNNYPGWTAHIFSGFPSASKTVGLRTSSKQQFYNGKIDSRLLTYKLFKGKLK
ncbi:MAG: THUMP domain-containing protein [Bacteroidota bacterium]|nr:THUMP domain-containing protein [Bacteroidota bacterium]